MTKCANKKKPAPFRERAYPLSFNFVGGFWFTTDYGVVVVTDTGTKLPTFSIVKLPPA